MSHQKDLCDRLEAADTRRNGSRQLIRTEVQTFHEVREVTFIYIRDCVEDRCDVPIIFMMTM